MVANEDILLAKEHDLTFDEDALTYLALAAESRLRTLLTSSLSAQLHRTTSSHTRLPPSSKSSGKPMWSYEAMSDPNAVLDALSRENKEAEQIFRANRMDRIAREAELQKAKERAERAAAYSTAVDSGPTDPTGDEDGQGEEADGQPGTSNTSTPVKASGSGAGSSGSSTPVFGAVSERKAGSSGRKSGKKAARDVSAEVAHKMSNATAMRSVGIFNKKQYSWLTSMPSVSSPLAGKERKGGKGGGSGGDSANEGEVESPAGDGEAIDGEEGHEGVKKEKSGDVEKVNGDADDHLRQGKKKQKVKSSERPQGDSGGGGTKRQRPRLTAPTRRMVVVSRDDKGVEKRLRDDHVLTVQDVLFALEREGVGKGMGSSEELIMRARILGEVDGLKRER